MNNFSILLAILFSINSIAQDRVENRDKGSSDDDLPSYSGKDFLTNPSIGNIDTLSTGSELLQKDIFKPNLEVNTNRGSLKASFGIVLPPNLLGKKNLDFTYNHRQQQNLGYGIGWSLSLPEIDYSDLNKNELSISSDGAFVKTECSNQYTKAKSFAERQFKDSKALACYKAMITSFPKEVIKYKSHFVLLNNSGSHFIFNKRGKVVLNFDKQNNSLLYKWNNNTLTQISNSFNNWKLNVSYLSKKTKPVAKNDYLYNPSVGINKIKITNDNELKIVDFKYNSEYLEMVSFRNSQKHLFKGSYKKIEASIEDSNYEHKKDFFHISKHNIYEALSLETPKEDKEDLAVYLDLNNDFRADKVVINFETFNSKIRSILSSIDYTVTSSSKRGCIASPDKSLSSIQRKMDRIRTSFDIHWAKVEGDDFSYAKDSSLSNIKQKLFDIKVVKKRFSNDDCDRIYYYKPIIYLKTPYIISMDSEHNDILWCKNDLIENRDKKDNSASSLLKTLKGNESYTNYPSEITKINFDQTKLKTINITEHLNTNVIAGVRTWSREKGPDCNGNATQLDTNNDGKAELISGDSVLYFLNSSVISKPLSSLTSLPKNTNDFKASKKLNLTNKNGVTEFIELDEKFSTPNGNIEISKDNSLLVSNGSKVKLLTDYYSHFKGTYKVKYKSKFNTQIVSKITKIDSKDLVHRITNYKYTDIMFDNILGNYIGFSDTKEIIKSNSTSSKKIISRKFLRDNNINVVLFDSRARLQGTLINKKVSSDNEGVETTYKKDAFNIGNNRLLLYTPLTVTTKFDGEDYFISNIIENYTLDNDLITKRTKTVQLRNSLINIHNDDQEYSLTTHYSDIGNSYIRKVKSTKYVDKTALSMNFSYDLDGNLKEESSDTKINSYKFDQLGRLTSISNKFGETTSVKYTSNIVSPTKVNTNGSLVSYERSNLYELVNQQFSNGETQTFSRNSDFELNMVEKEGIVQFKKEPFKTSTDKIALPLYSFYSKGQNYNVQLDDFGSVLNVQTEKSGRPFTIFKNLTIDNKVLKSFKSFYENTEKEFTIFEYDGYGREKLSRVQNSNRPINTITNYTKGCTQKYTNGIFISKNCNTNSNTSFTEDLNERNYLGWDLNQNLVNINNALKWSVDPNGMLSSFSFNNETLTRSMDFDNNILTFKDKTITYDKFNRISNASIGDSNTEIQYTNGKITLEQISSDTTNYFQSYVYNKNKLSKIKNEDYSNKYSYDQFDRLKSEHINTSGSILKIAYKYDSNELSQIYPFISDITYDKENNISSIVYANGTEAKFEYLTGTPLFTSIIYSNKKNLHTQRNEYDELYQLKNISISNELAQSFDYKNFKIQNKVIKTINTDKLNTCEEYLCGLEKENGESFNFLYHPTRGLVAGIDSKGATFRYINENEVLINGEYLRLIKLNDTPVGLIKGKELFPTIINFKKEVIGLIDPSGKEVLFIRDYDFNGNKSVKFNKSFDQDKLQDLDKKLVWSFGRLRHNPLSDNQEYYWSASRTYSTKLGQWTTIDPLVAWNPKKLASTFGNWNPYVYCNGDSVNCVDTSGYFGHLLVGGAIGGLAGGISALATGQNVIQGALIGATVGVFISSGAALVSGAVGTGALAAKSSVAGIFGFTGSLVGQTSFSNNISLSQSFLAGFGGSLTSAFSSSLGTVYDGLMKELAIGLSFMPMDVGMSIMIDTLERPGKATNNNKFDKFLNTNNYEFQ